MKVLAFKIPKTENESCRVQVDQSAYFYDTLHKHSEIQITLIVKSSGTLICGDYVGNFHEDDLFIVGANQAHVLRNNKEYYTENAPHEAHAISLFFDENSFGPGFFKLPEMALLHTFLTRTHRGLIFGEKTKAKIKPRMFAIEHQAGMDKLLGMLELLKILAEAEDCEPLATATKVKDYDEHEGKRINQIFQLTMQEYHRDITLAEVSALANMTPNAFCRFFKKKTRKTYINFLNEIRVANACKLLNDKDLTIAQVGYHSGFNNLSNFNRNFKKVQGCSPSAYRRKSG